MAISPPETEDLFVFTDIHGCANELKLLLNKLPLQSKSTLVFLGDYVDRGENSKEVLDVIIELRKNYNVVTLKGNHEDLFLGFLEDPTSEKAATFIYNGGNATLASYGDQVGHYHVPDNHIDFLNSLPLFYETDEFFFVHAGVPNIPLNKIDTNIHGDQLMWLRSSFLESKYKWKKTIVHGHTPTQDVFTSKRRINIDTGCVYNNRLSSLHLPSKKVYSVALNHKIKEVVLRDSGSQRRTVRFDGSIPVYIFLDGVMHEFETVNYSATGLFLRDVINTDIEVLKDGQKITGEIGRHNQDTILFEGDVVRCVRENNFIHYAINMTKSPFEFFSKPWG